MGINKEQPLSERLIDLPDWKLSYRIEEAVAATGIGRTIIFQRIKEKKIKARKDGRTVLILRTDLLDYLLSLPDAR